jgi:hypothetical protein
VGVDRGAAEQPLVELELAESIQKPPGGADYFRTDPVSREDDYARYSSHDERTLWIGWGWCADYCASMLSRT